jgi:hypothetical protein
MHIKLRTKIVYSSIEGFNRIHTYSKEPLEETK